MSRSKEGLFGAGEWPVLKGLLLEFQGEKVLDLGCGYGWHSIYAIEKGASSVVGVDISERMLAVAREKTNYEDIEYLCVPIEDIDFKEESFDIVISSLAFHYIKDYETLIKKISKLLRPEGKLSGRGCNKVP